MSATRYRSNHLSSQGMEAPKVPPLAAPDALRKYTQVEKFLSNHKKIRGRVDNEGGKALCISKEKMTTPSMNISDDELALHIKVFNMHNYTAEALSDVFCSRDAMRELAERLSTAER